MLLFISFKDKVKSNYFKLYSDTVILQGDFRFEDLDVIDADSTFVIAQESVSWDDVAEIIEGCVV